MNPQWLLLSEIARAYLCKFKHVLYKFCKTKTLIYLFFQQRLHFHDAAPSPFSQSHKSTPQRHPSDQSDGSSTPSSVFPWGRDDSRPAPRRLSPSSSQATGADVTNRQQAQLEPGVCGKESDYRRETDSECRCQMVNLVTVVVVQFLVFLTSFISQAPDFISLSNLGFIRLK